MPQPPTPTSPSPSDSLPSPLPSATETPAPAIPSPPLNLSLVERLIYNNTPAHAALWTPDALNQHHVLNRPSLPHPPTKHHTVTNNLPRCLTTTNLPDDRYEGLARPLASLPPLAPDPPDAGQPCHANTYGQAAGPTYNLYPLSLPRRATTTPRPTFPWPKMLRPLLIICGCPRPARTPST